MRAIPLILLLLLYSLSGGAQSGKPAYRNELLLQLGSAGSNGYEPAGHGLDWSAPKRGSFGLLRNAGALQYGVQLEAGTESAQHWYVAPTLTGNYRVRYKKGYGYVGIAAGYFLNRNGYAVSEPESAYTQGYQVGLQTGFAYDLGARFAICGELAFRHVIRWREEFEWYAINPSNPTPYIAISTGKVPQTSMLIPATLGVRYHFGGGKRSPVRLQ